MEVDEYDWFFLYLSFNIVVVFFMDVDYFDIYGDWVFLYEIGFWVFVKKLELGGKLYL